MSHCYRSSSPSERTSRAVAVRGAADGGRAPVVRDGPVRRTPTNKRVVHKKRNFVLWFERRRAVAIRQAKLYLPGEILLQLSQFSATRARYMVPNYLRDGKLAFSSGGRAATARAVPAAIGIGK